MGNNGLKKDTFREKGKDAVKSSYFIQPTAMTVIRPKGYDLLLKKSWDQFVDF